MVRRRPILSVVLGTITGILILASGCVDQTPTAVQLVPGTTLSASKAYSRGTYATSIGPQGGILYFPVGQIEFPAGAVTKTTRIRAELDGRTLAVDFHPHLVFPENARPTLTLSYRGVRVRERNIAVSHFDDEGRLIEVLLPKLNAAAQEAIIHPSGFSGYALISQ